MIVCAVVNHFCNKWSIYYLTIPINLEWSFVIAYVLCLVRKLGSLPLILFNILRNLNSYWQVHCQVQSPKSPILLIMKKCVSQKVLIVTSSKFFWAAQTDYYGTACKLLRKHRKLLACSKEALSKII